MKLRVAPTAGRPQRQVIRSVIVSVLAMAAMLLGLLAIHSATSGARHDMSVTASTAAAPSEHPAGANRVKADTVAAVAAVAVASGMDSAWLSFGSSFMAGCGILALTCAALLIVAALFRLARRASVYARLIDAGGLHVRSVRMTPLKVYRPSLTLLSISRI